MNRMFWGASILLLPFIVELGAMDQLRLPKAKFLVLLAFLYGAVYYWNEIDRPLGVGIALIGISSFFSRTYFPFNDLLLCGAGLFAGLWAKSPTRGQVRCFLKLLEVSAIICAAYGLIQYAELDPIMHLVPGTTHWRPVALLGQHTLYGPFAIAGLLASLFLGRKWRALFLALPFPFIDSSFTYLSLAAGIYVFLVFRLGKKFAVCSGAIGAIALVGIVSTFLLKKDYTNTEALNDKGRFKVWAQAAHLGRIHPISGYGFGSFKEVYPAFQHKAVREANGLKDEDLSPEAKKFIADAEYIHRESGTFLSVHNEYIQAFMEMGWPAVFSILAIIGSFYFSFYFIDKDPEVWALAALFSVFLVNSCGNFIFHLVPQALIPLWSFVALKTYSPTKWEAYEHP